MTTLLEKAIQKLSSLPEEDQDRYAREILAAIDGDAAWEELFEDPRSETLLSQMVARARAEHEAGTTRPLDELLAGTGE